MQTKQHLGRAICAPHFKTTLSITHKFEDTRVGKKTLEWSRWESELCAFKKLSKYKPKAQWLRGEGWLEPHKLLERCFAHQHSLTKDHKKFQDASYCWVESILTCKFHEKSGNSGILFHCLMACKFESWWTLNGGLLACFRATASAQHFHLRSISACWDPGV